MKLAALITIYNGLELLDKCIENIEPYVDEIVLCYQKKSNTGNTSNIVFPAVKKYIEKKKFHVINFEPEGLNTKDKEMQKHNYMIDYAKGLQCSHLLFLATDHFYLHDEFINAKQEALKYDVTFTKMFTYYKYPTWQITPIEDYYMPFICKLYSNTKIDKFGSRQYPVKVDPALMINNSYTHKIFEQNVIMLHHYSMVRENIRDKFKNAAASIRWSDDKITQFINEFENYSISENNGIAYFGGRKIKLVDDYFSLNPNTILQ